MIIVYSLLIFFYSLLILVHYLSIIFLFYIYYCIFTRIYGNRGLVVEDRISKPEELNSIPPCSISLFSSKNRRKFPVITENFGTWGRKFPAQIKQSFSPTQQDESCVIRAGWRNSAERLVTVWSCPICQDPCTPKA